MSRITHAYCVQLKRVVTIDEARREFLSQVPALERYDFLCPSEGCRRHGVRMTGIAYRTAAVNHGAYIAAHFRHQDQHRPECSYATSAQQGIVPKADEWDAEFLQLQAHRKLTDVIDEFDPRSEEDTLTTPGAGNGAADTRRLSRFGYAAQHAPGPLQSGRRTTQYLDRVVDTYLEAHSQLSRAEFRSLRLYVRDQGPIRLVNYFRSLSSMPLNTAGRVIYGGAWLLKSYRFGFKLRFFDMVEGFPVFLHVSAAQMRTYRYHKYLAFLAEQAQFNWQHYLQVFALGRLQLDSQQGRVYLQVDDLRHLTILLKPRKSQSSESVGASRDDISAAIRH